MTLPTQIDDLVSPVALRSRLGDLLQDAWNLNPRLTDRLPEVFSKMFVPPVNLAETDKAIIVTLEAPGLDESDFDVQVSGNHLTVTGEKKFEEDKIDSKDFRRVERQYGKFSRSVTLPTEVRDDEVDALYAKGVLTVTIPKAASTSKKKVKIRAK
ncbi:MAG: Hsp20/alpha crystallin family protein [Planctomycetes bacterium]|nr:Hsp20/alpha crystallin family protein [Planctomycetota bacterium]MCB9920161.1 Hsp20/alpha crystallin family protein [Planctomycetota bacterium]